MRLQVPRKVGVELQNTAEDADVTSYEIGTREGRMELETEPAADERDDCLIKEKDESNENLAEPNYEQQDVEPVDDIIAGDSTSGVDKVDEQVRSTGLRTVRSLVNGGLAILALGALSPVGLFLKHLDGLNDGEDNETEARDSEGDERTEDDNDL